MIVLSNIVLYLFLKVVICANRCRTDQRVAEILTHELVHLYDNCTAKVDFNNLHHLACTEVR
jgi:inner membrane protease ATP23